jgi:hypothetical protein
MLRRMKRGAAQAAALGRRFRKPRLNGPPAAASAQSLLLRVVPFRGTQAKNSPSRGGSLGVIAVKGDRCGVVMKLVERHPELPDDMGHDREHKAWDVGCEQRGECSPDAIVVEPTEVFSSRAKSFLHPFRTRRLVYEAVLRK